MALLSGDGMGAGDENSAVLEFLDLEDPAKIGQALQQPLFGGMHDMCGMGMLGKTAFGQHLGKKRGELLHADTDDGKQL